MRQIKLTEETKKDILTTLLKRSPSQYPEYEKTVSEILNNVRNNGDKAVFEYTEKFDGYKYDENTWSNLVDTYVEFTLKVNQREKDKLITQPVEVK